MIRNGIILTRVPVKRLKNLPVIFYSMTNPMEDMLMPCPLDICDGTGEVAGVEPWDSERKCPCREDEGDVHGL